MRQPKGWGHFTANRSTTVLTEVVRIFIEFTTHDYKTATLVTVGTYAAFRAVKLCLYDCGVVLHNNKQRVHDFFSMQMTKDLKPKHTVQYADVNDGSQDNTLIKTVLPWW